MRSRGVTENYDLNRKGSRGCSNGWPSPSCTRTGSKVPPLSRLASLTPKERLREYEEYERSVEAPIPGTRPVDMSLRPSRPTVEDSDALAVVMPRVASGRIVGRLR